MRPLDYSRQAKMEVRLLKKLNSRKELGLAYTPGIAEVAKEIMKNEEAMFEFTFRKNSLAVISEGSAVLGLGNIGHKAAYPIMEGKAMLFKKFGGINAVPIVIKTQDVREFINTVKNIADSFGAINLEDISAPRCFEIEKILVRDLPIPVMHDDQHGTAIVVLAAIINALKILPKHDLETKIVIFGAGAAGTGIIKLLNLYGFKNLLACDSKGIINQERQDLNEAKKELLKITNPHNVAGGKEEALKSAEIFIGVSRPGQLTESGVNMMAKQPIILAMANPIPEIMPELAYKAGAGMVGTGRSDFINQVNNALVFPGLFRGAMDARVKITDKLKLTAAQALVEYHQKKLNRNNLMPSILDKKVHQFIAKRVCLAGKHSGG
ncbi:MAG: NADP-dependent malic enzyme [Patescibacteria group bacterium]|nr:NADP-dependent malic enzyme [Patescibacteria group bacterium]